MCGIVGLAGNFHYPDVMFFRNMLLLDTIRGPHSTGILSVDPDGSHQMYKKAVDGFNFLAEKRTDEIIQSTDVLLLGHNRWATMGAVTDENAHPFEHGNVIGVHNGTLNYGYNDHLFEKINAPTKLSEVDSENLYYALSKGDPREVLKRTHGALALVWYNKEEHRLYFIRNDKRPLVFAFNKKRDKFVIASDPRIITLSRDETRGCDFTPDTEHGLVTACTENTLYGIDLFRSYQEIFKDFAVREKVAIGSVFKTFSSFRQDWPEARWWETPPAQRQQKQETSQQKTAQIIHYHGPKTIPSPNPNKLPPKPIIQMTMKEIHTEMMQSQKAWNDYCASSDKRNQNSDYITHLDTKAERMNRSEIIHLIRQWVKMNNDTTNIWTHGEVLPNKKDYRLKETMELVNLYTKIDYATDVIKAWTEVKPPAICNVVFKQLMNEGLDLKPLMETIKQSTLLPEQQILPFSNHSEQEQSIIDQLEVPSGLGNYTMRQFKRKVKDEGCGHCSAQNINWEPTDCSLTANNQIICPDCMADSLFLSYVSQGQVKLA